MSEPPVRLPEALSAEQGVGVPGDRRQPVARYVEFGREGVHQDFIATAEAAYQRLAASDAFESGGEVRLRVAAAPARGRLLRRSRPVVTEQVVPTTAALARIAHAVADLPEAVASAERSCRHTTGVARTLASVTSDLLRDLVSLEPGEQAAHAAYRQTLRLAAELQCVGEIVMRVGCGDADGCVGIRAPEHWGRRLEDVEVGEVRSVLLRLADAGGS